MSTTSADEANPKCPHCGLIHDSTCPRIKAIEYNDDGRLKRIEFHAQPAVTAAALSRDNSVFDIVFGKHRP